MTSPSRAVMRMITPPKLLIIYLHPAHPKTLIDLNFAERLFVTAPFSIPYYEPTGRNINHVYLDTVVLLGTVAAQHENRLAFGLGATTASFAFFFALGYGARLLRPIFARPAAWRVLDLLVGVLMCGIAISLLV